MGLFGGNSIGVRDFGTPPGFIPLLVLFGLITLPFWAAILGVFPGMPWHYDIQNHILSGIIVILFITATYMTHRAAPVAYRNGLLWLLTFLWGFFGLLCWQEIEAILAV